MKRAIRILHTVEDSLLVTILTAMILLAVSQIALRNLFDTSLSWGDPLLRIMVLWTALLGAMAATRMNNHIRIDLLSRFIPENLYRWVTRFTNLFAASICTIIAWHAYRFVMFEREDGIILFATVPAWVCELIIPIAFATMAIRFAIQTLIPLEVKQ